jgi:hypothetical protein
MSLRISAYRTDDGLIFEDDLVAKQHDYWLQMLTLVDSMPLQASSESPDDIRRQRASWLCENAKQIAKLAKHATDNRAVATNGGKPDAQAKAMLEGDDK